MSGLCQNFEPPTEGERSKGESLNLNLLDSTDKKQLQNTENTLKGVCEEKKSDRNISDVPRACPRTTTGTCASTTELSYFVCLLTS